MNKILIVEDDEVIQNELSKLLENNGFETVILKDFSQSLDIILKEKADLILMDINIPFINGEMLLRQIRENSEVPVIMVTSRTQEIDEVLSMSYGADDYIMKPYNPTLLILRINAVLKRANKHYSHYEYYHDAEINSQRGIIKRQNDEIVLTKNEMIIFNILKENMGKIVSRDELMTALWDSNSFINDNALTVNISRLRNKLNSLGFDNVIETRKGLGYILL